jgi:hypothetical protein
MNQKLLALYGLKFAPFSPEVPTEALYLSPKIENFCWRIEQAHLREGGWALIHGYDKEPIMKMRESFFGRNRDFHQRRFPLFNGMYRRLVWNAHTRRCTCQLCNCLPNTLLG